MTEIINTWPGRGEKANDFAQKTKFDRHGHMTRTYTVTVALVTPALFLLLNHHCQLFLLLFTIK
ncbi:hypothetical protein BV25DRAFT_1821390 [Artomyces pyxidatus]|uniref:Uncharacterized protein n=1 Tax=Artomyces pyxidatus TaxID=48021 RepID=A0ACB8TAZ6_9AGAM|nr:hypothetical protein BV25DRAFT_1821390 [Artomyces pyxidatus]